MPTENRVNPESGDSQTYYPPVDPGGLKTSNQETVLEGQVSPDADPETSPSN
jgi:hypothetical protein